MKTNELKCPDLRIGNLIDYFGDIIKVDVIEIFDGKERVGGETKDGRRVFDKPTYFDPIELTEEVLEKICFEKEERPNSVIYYLDYDVDEDNRIRVRYVIYKSKSLSLLKIMASNDIIFETQEFSKRGVKYLHELQNAYFLLTNKELEIEL